MIANSSRYIVYPFMADWYDGAKFSQSGQTSEKREKVKEEQTSTNKRGKRNEAVNLNEPQA